MIEGGASHGSGLAIQSLLLAGLLLTPGIAVGGTRRDDVPDSSYTSLGVQTEFQSVGEVTATGLGTGSGTLIGSRWVLTAGNVVSFPNPSAVTFHINGVDYTAATWLRHSSWNDDTANNGFDIGLIRLDTPVADITPAMRYSGSNELGATATIVGYGDTGTGLTGELAGTFGTKRAGTNVLDVLGGSAGGHNNYLIADFDSPHSVLESSFGSSTPLSLEYSSASGDHGGGVFISDGGVQKLVGIVSFGQHGPYATPDGVANADYGDLMGFTRVSAFNDWIDDNAAAQWNNAAGGSIHAPGNWQAAYIPDSTDILRFNINGTYTTTFSGDNSYSKILARKGWVTLDLGGGTQTVSSQSLTGSVTVGRDGIDNARLILTNGILDAVDAFIGSSSGSSGYVILDGLGTQWNLSDSLYVGGNSTGSGGFGTLLVKEGTSVQVENLLRVNGTVNLNGGTITTQNLEFSAGRMLGSSGGSLTASGSDSTWTAGEIEGAVVNIPVGGMLTITPSALNSVEISSGSQLQVSGTVILNGSSSNVRHTVGTSTIQIASSGVFDLQSIAGFVGSGGTINNAGMFRKSIDTGEALIHHWVFNNTGTVDVQSGALTLPGGISTGHFRTAVDATLEFDNAILELTGATFDNAGATNFSNARANFDTPVTIAGTSSFNRSTISGTGQVTLNDTSWTSSILTNTGGIIIPQGGSLLISGFGGVEIDSDSLLHIAGTATLNGSASGGVVRVGGAPTVQIDPTGVFDIQSTAGFDTHGGSGGTINNAGTFQKSIGTGIAEIDRWTFNNSGTVDVQSGTLELGGNGTSPGIFRTAVGTNLRFKDGTHNLTGATLDNAGTIRIQSGGIAQFNSPVSIPGVVILSTGAISSSSEVSIDSLSWTAGEIRGPGVVRIPTGGTLLISGAISKFLSSGGTLNIAGTATWTGTGDIRGALSGSSINILAGGIFDVQNDVPIVVVSGSGYSINNAGTFRKSIGTGTTSILDWSLNNTGTIDVQSGTLSIGNSFNQTDPAARILLRGGTISKSSALTIQAGSLEGTGTVTAEVQNHGTISPGESAGKLTFNGNLTYFSDAHTRIELGGLTPVTHFDQIVVNGAVTLDGALEVNLIDAGQGLFTPAAGNVFEILTATGNISGAFASISLPVLPDGLAWEEVDYGLHSIHLRVGLVPGDYNFDGIVNAADYAIWRDTMNDLPRYQGWRSNFGSMGGSESGQDAAVPEPTSFGLFLIAVVFGPLARTTKKFAFS